MTDWALYLVSMYGAPDILETPEMTATEVKLRQQEAAAEWLSKSIDMRLADAICGEFKREAIDRLRSYEIN